MNDNIKTEAGQTAEIERILSIKNKKDHFAILGLDVNLLTVEPVTESSENKAKEDSTVPKHLPLDDVKKKYKQGVLYLHPDKCRHHPKAADAFHLFDASYKILTDDGGKVFQRFKLAAERKKKMQAARPPGGAQGDANSSVDDTPEARWKRQREEIYEKEVTKLKQKEEEARKKQQEEKEKQRLKTELDQSLDQWNTLNKQLNLSRRGKL